MRILLLTHAFNSLTQRLFVELAERGHDLSVELDINDRVTAEAVELFHPDLVLAPYLRRRIADAVWQRCRCLVVHPGPVGDRGPSALDWAILEAVRDWGVTCFQATHDYDAGPVWASAACRMRAAAKSSLYRGEVSEAAVAAVMTAIDRIASGEEAEPVDPSLPAHRGWRPAMKQADRAIDWARDDTQTVLRKIRSADGRPGLRDQIDGIDCFLHDAWPAKDLEGPPGALLARCHGAVARATADGAAWIGHLRRAASIADPTLKLPATTVLRGRLDPALPENETGYDDIRYREADDVGHLHFDFYGGAMSVGRCRRLLAAYRDALTRPTRAIVLWGGRDFWSNGMDLSTIEAADSPADKSWASINAIDDLAEAVIRTQDRLTIAALQGDAGAGGVFLALAADRVLARAGIVLNPHYKNMGNLYGSEYWTYLLPRRIGATRAETVTEGRLPMGTAAAQRLGLIDAVIAGDVPAFRAAVAAYARDLATDPGLPRLVADKRARRGADEAARPLSDYRREELEQMKLNFYGFDPSYHVARYHFVTKSPAARTPLHLARHRRPDRRS